LKRKRFFFEKKNQKTFSFPLALDASTGSKNIAAAA
jgi:hypothetical protein